MPTVKQDMPISEDEYLEGEKISDLKYEYINGYVYAMSGASANHLKGIPCRSAKSRRTTNQAAPSHNTDKIC